jgi:hypothetical protein
MADVVNPVTDLTAEAKGLNLVLRWEIGDGPIPPGYFVLFYKFDGAPWTPAEGIRIDDPATREYVLAVPQAGPCMVRVRAHATGTPSSYMDAPAAPYYPKPQNVAAKQVTGALKVRATWEAPAEMPVVNYLANIKPANGAFGPTFTPAADATSWDFDVPEPGSYVVRLRNRLGANTAISEGVDVPVEVVDPRNLTSIRVSRISRTSAVVEWDEVPGAGAYELELRAGDGVTNSRTFVGAGSPRFWTLSGLSAGTWYEVTGRVVRNVNADPGFEWGVGDWQSSRAGMAEVVPDYEIFRSGFSAARVVRSVAGDTGTMNVHIPDAKAYPAVEGQQWYGSAWVYNGTDITRAIRAALVVMIPGGTSQWIYGTSPGVPPRTWTNVAVSGVMPVGAGAVKLNVEGRSNWDLGEWWSLDEATLEQEPGPGPFGESVTFRTVMPPPPPPSPTLYVGADWTAELGGRLLGGASPFVLEEVSGLLDAPDIRTSDKELLQRDGLIPGNDYLGGRVFTIDLSILDPDVNLPDAMAMFKPGGTERAFRFAFPGVAGGRGYVACRVRKRDIKVDMLHVRGAAKVSLELAASDPLLYSDVEQIDRVNPPTPRGGTRMFPMRFPFKFVQPVALRAAASAAVNNGNTATWPKFRMVGPMLRPSIENKATGAKIELDMRLPSGEVLEINTKRREVLHNGANVFGAVTPTSEWFALEPGVNHLELNAASGYEGMYAEATWRSAWL